MTTFFFFVLLVSGDDVKYDNMQPGRDGRDVVLLLEAHRVPMPSGRRKNKISRVRTRALEFFLLTDLTLFTKAQYIR